MLKSFRNADIYDQAYLERLRSLEIKRKVIVDILKNYKALDKAKVEVLTKNLEHPNKQGLRRINPIILSFLLDSLFTIRESIEIKISEFEKNKLSRYVLFEILFWSKPSTYPFPNEKVENYKAFLAKKRQKLKEAKLENFLQLYALESIEKDTFLRDVKEEIFKVKPENLEEYLWINDFVDYLSPIEKSEIKNKVHPYVWKVLNSKSKTIPVVIDGNNILLASELRGPERIDALLELISKLDQTYFPFYLVFDANAKYKFHTRYFNYKRTYYHSPADELILGLAREIKGVVCSKDKFKDYNMNIRNIWYDLKL
ncbi:ribonuclease [Fervidobacterium pennivorans]|uniref:ribonuclease n=1 Tax=Fervidobacterium pennivorans TaxID=93466 RepID=UPI001436AD60|nr:ribonuclease [Fervidobacterium pennivorans]QIV78009.1 ribonuclease [Fervidobacterium pennivorans subsp. keratinolyticus]